MITPVKPLARVLRVWTHHSKEASIWVTTKVHDIMGQRLSRLGAVSDGKGDAFTAIDAGGEWMAS